MTTEAPVALITGAAKRIGAAVARLLHQRGFNVIIHYQHSEHEAVALVSDLNNQRANSASAIGADLSCHNAITRMAEQVKQQCSALTVLINNASSFYPTPVDNISLEDWRVLMGSNAKGPLFLTQKLIGHLATDAMIGNIVDIHIERPLYGHTVYSMAKSALCTMTRSLALELAPRIRVNAVAPGAILWPERGISEQDKAKLINTIPLERLGTPSDIAETLWFLINAPYITGQIIHVDGGRSINAVANY